MDCPVCKDTKLVMTERQNIEIDYCPNCRGVWLDRGELDKIIERSQQYEPPRSDSGQAQAPSFLNAPLEPWTRPGPAAPQPTGGAYGENHFGNTGQQYSQDHHGNSHPQSGQPSFLKRLFDN